MRNRISVIVAVIISSVLLSGAVSAQETEVSVLTMCIDSSAIVSRSLRSEINNAKSCTRWFSEAFFRDYSSDTSYARMMNALKCCDVNKAYQEALSVDKGTAEQKDLLMARMAVLSMKIKEAEYLYDCISKPSCNPNFNVLIEKASFLLYMNTPQQAIIAAQNALDVATLPEQVCRARLMMAKAYLRNNNGDDALAQLNAILSEKIKKKPKTFDATTDMLRGMAFSAKGEADVALLYYNDALKKFGKYKSAFEEPLRILRRCADIYNEKGDIAKVSEAMEQCIVYCKQYKNTVSRATTLASVYLQWGNILKNAGCFNDARKKLQESLQLIGTIVKTNRNYAADLAEVESAQAAIEIEMKDFRRAEAMCQDAYGIYSMDEYSKSDYALVGKASLLNTYGALYNAMGRYGEAAKKYNESLEIYARLSIINNKLYLGEKATVLNNIGMLYENMGDFENAMKYYKLASVNFEATLSLQTNYEAAYGNALASVGNLYRKCMQTDSALCYLEQGLHIFRHKEKLTDAENADYSTICNNLAVLYRQKGKPEIAEQFYETAYHIRKELSEKSEVYLPLWCDIMNNYGLFFIDNGDLDLAIYYLAKALEIRNEIYTDKGIGAAVIADNYDNLAYAYHTSRMQDLAIENYEKSRRIRQELVSSDPNRNLDDYMSTMQNLAALYKQEGRLVDALAVMVDLREVVSSLLITDDEKKRANLADILHNTALLYSALNQKQQAIDAMNNAIDEYTVLAVVDRNKYAKEVASALIQAGNYYTDIYDYDNAEKYYRKALEINTELCESGLTKVYDLAANFNNLGLMYYQQSEMDKAKECYLKARKIFENSTEISADIQTALNRAMVDINIVVYYIYEKNSELVDDNFSVCDEYLHDAINSLKPYLSNPSANYYHEYALKLMDKIIK